MFTWTFKSTGKKQKIKKPKALVNATPRPTAGKKQKITSLKNRSKLRKAMRVESGKIASIYFQTYWRTESREEFAHQAALPVAVKVNDISREELIEIVDRIIAAAPHTSFFLDVLRANVPHPRVSNLIFWPQKEGLTSLPTSEEIVSAAISYKPIQL